MARSRVSATVSRELGEQILKFHEENAKQHAKTVRIGYKTKIETPSFSDSMEEILRRGLQESLRSRMNETKR